MITYDSVITHVCDKQCRRVLTSILDCAIVPPDSPCFINCFVIRVFLFVEIRVVNHSRAIIVEVITYVTITSNRIKVIAVQSSFGLFPGSDQLPLECTDSIAYHCNIIWSPRQVATSDMMPTHIRLWLTCMTTHLYDWIRKYLRASKSKRRSGTCRRVRESLICLLPASAALFVRPK